jgi:hypothetical protein
MMTMIPLFALILGCWGGEPTSQEVVRPSGETQQPSSDVTSRPNPEVASRPSDEQGGSDDALKAFWIWFHENEAELEAKVAKGMTPELQSAMIERVTEIHPKLAWEFGSGAKAKHSLALSGEGDPLLRLLAERWRAKGPGNTETWEFHTTKQPTSPEAVVTLELRIGGRDFKFSDARISISENKTHRLLDVWVYHPLFADVDEQLSGTVTFIMLDSVVGEDAVERWIGGVEIAKDLPETSLGLAEFRDLVDGLVVKWPPGEDVWIMAEGKDPRTGEVQLYMLNPGLKRWDHPFEDTWCELKIPYPPAQGGMPNPTELETLNGKEDELLGLLDEEAVFLGHRTGAGSRSIFLYIDDDSDVVSRIKGWADSAGRPIEIETVFDPGWSNRP